MGQVDGKYESALMMIMKMADADSIPDLDQWQTVADKVMTNIENLDKDLFDKDLRNVLVEKAVGTVHTKVNNGLAKGGVYVYVDIYKHFTETSGLGLAAQALKLIHPDNVNSDDDLAVRLEDRVQKCNRLPDFGDAHELPVL